MSFDPFAVFGDDDEEGEETEKAETIQVSHLLVEAANRNRMEPIPQPPQNNLGKSNHQSFSKSDDFVQNLDPANHHVHPWPLPMFLGPITLVRSLADFGGGRGYVASKDLAPGTLILVEEPMVPWQDDHPLSFGLEMVLALLVAENAQRTIPAMEHFHPTKEAIDAAAFDDEQEKAQIKDMMEMLSSKYRDDVLLADCVTLARQRNITSSNGASLNQDDCLRLLLAIQYNSLESGIYLHAAMLNHADQPNCVKFTPTNGYSEVRTTRSVFAGEPLTISYIPRIISHASRRKYLFDQHRFDIGSDPGPKLRVMELIGGDLPVSSIQKWSDDTVTHRIETATAELRRLYQDIEHDMGNEELVKNLEQASLELCHQALEQLRNNRHLLLIPCFELHLDCCERAQQLTSLKRSHRHLLLSRTVESAMQLASLQTLFRGSDHFDLARSNLDLAEAVEELLAQSPKDLLRLTVNKEDELNSVSSWASLAHRARKEHNRIKALYPYDTDAWINSNLESAPDHTV